MRDTESSWSDEDLARLRVKNGVRLRGLEMTRTETFTDAAFAFAVTLLVISIDAIPTTFDELLGALQGIPAFLMSFALLMNFWAGHWSWSRRYGLEDAPSILLSLLLVFLVLCYVYPLKYLSGLCMLWLSGGRFSSGASIDSGQQLYGIFIIYGFGFAAISLVLTLLHLHALRCAKSLNLNTIERFSTIAGAGAWAILCGAGFTSALLSILLATTLPASILMAPIYIYPLLGIIMPIYGVLMSRRGARLQAADTAR